MTDKIVVLTTCASGEEAEKIARGLVEKRLAACVNVLGGARSFYRWQGALEDEFAGATLDRTEGLKVLLPDGWVHLRASNTEPVLRVAVEARSEPGAEELYDRVKRLVG